MIELTPDAILLIGIMIGMTALTVLFLARPWLSQTTEAGIDRSKFTVQVYRDQLAELETDMNEQRLTEQQYTEARHELERSMMDDIGQSSPSVPLPPPEKTYNAGLWALILVAIALPILALLLYGVLHISIAALAPQQDFSENSQGISNQNAPLAAQPGSNFNIEEMVGRLATRLQNNPEDSKGWAMLGRSYTVLKRYPESAEAYGRSYQLRSAATLTANDAEMVANYAEALSLANDNSLEGRVSELVEQALQLNAQETKALWMGGMSAFRTENFKLATRRWQQLYELTPRSSELSQILPGAIEEAKIRSGEMIIVPDQTAAPAQTPAESMGSMGSMESSPTDGSPAVTPVAQ